MRSRQCRSRTAKGYFREENHDQHELSRSLIEFLHRLDFVEIDDYVVDKDESSVEVRYACTLAQARTLGFTSEQIRDLKDEG